jgi:hypothetical protein
MSAIKAPLRYFATVECLRPGWKLLAFCAQQDRSGWLLSVGNRGLASANACAWLWL